MDNNNQWQQQPNMQQPYNIGVQQPYGMGTQQNYKMGTQQYYNGQPQYNMGMQQNNKKGLSIASLILGIISVTLCCCFGWLPGLIGIILGIIGILKEPKGRVMAIIGIILSTLALIMSLLVGVLDLDDAFMKGFEEEYSNIHDASNIIKEELSQSVEENGGDASILYDDEHFWGSKYVGSDESAIYFYEDGTFEWFLYDKDYDNIKTGTYEVMFGYDARDWLVDEHPEYGITQDELKDYWSRNADSDLYRRENLTVLVLNTEVSKYGGEQQNDKPYTVNYYGYSNEVGFDGVNLSTFNYMTLYTEE